MDKHLEFHGPFSLIRKTSLKNNEVVLASKTITSFVDLSKHFCTHKDIQWLEITIEAFLPISKKYMYQEI